MSLSTVSKEAKELFLQTREKHHNVEYVAANSPDPYGSDTKLLLKMRKYEQFIENYRQVPEVPDKANQWFAR